jgi:hypothetical protein
MTKKSKNRFSSKKVLFVMLVFLVVGQVVAVENAIDTTREQKFMDGEFWRDQVLTELMPYWYKHVRDEKHGAFYLNLSRDWQPKPPWDKMPAMISRQIFSFSTAYLLSGEEKYLEVARKATDYLLQIYNNVGLTQYYFVTGDERALSHVLQSVEIHKTYAHDK